jgi:hypothetical protein
VHQQGMLVIRGTMPDGLPADSIHVIFDQDTLGYRPNPDTLFDLKAGTHRVEVKTVDPFLSTLEYLNIPHNIVINHGQTTTDNCQLTADIPVAPYVGFKAPSFSVTDINSNPVVQNSSLQRVTLLYFFAFT